jgi:hypothetical protein
MVPLEGSYDLTLRNVIATTAWDASTGRASPSEGAHLRIDIRKLPSGLIEALVTPRWGQPVTYSVFVEPAAVVLTGQPELQWPARGATIANLELSDTWSKLRIAFDASTGMLGGSGSPTDLQAFGDESTINTDTSGKIATLTGEGTVGRDATAPEVRSEIRSPLLPMGELLPWEALALRAAEGVGAGPLSTGIHVRPLAQGDAGNASVSFRFMPEDVPTGWGGVVMATGRTRSWEGLPGREMEIAVARTAVVDSAKHEMAADYAAMFRFLDIGPAVASQTFDGPLPGSWGDVTFRTASDADPLCENGGCAVMGPFQRGICRVKRLGIAGHLSTPAGGDKLQLRVRYRVMRMLNWGSPPPFSVDVARPGQEPLSTEVSVLTLKDSGADAGDLRFVTDFLDLRVPLPEATAPADASAGIGFAIYAGTKDAIACNSPHMNYEVKTQVIIDAVTLEVIAP